VFERFFDESGGMQLIVHAPLGSRINRALGLGLRKKFCLNFDFELQAAASNDAALLSLGPQHSFPLEDVPAFLRSHNVQDAVTQAVLRSPMFTARWRWNLNRSLAVLRRKGGKLNPFNIQRMEADDVMAAVFPDLAACQDNSPAGPVEIPDHVLVRETLKDCLTEAMDIDGLKELVSRFEQGTIRLHFVDTVEPSVLSHEILNGAPFTYLDEDAEIGERRSRAAQGHDRSGARRSGARRTGSGRAARRAPVTGRGAPAARVGGALRGPRRRRQKLRGTSGRRNRRLVGSNRAPGRARGSVPGRAVRTRPPASASPRRARRRGP
jgi:Lhr-like helicase